MGIEEELLPKSECPFCQIAQKKLQALIVGENENSIAFLDLNPANFGHVIVIPKKHYEKLEEIPENEVKDLMLLVQETVKKLRRLSIKIGDEDFEPYGITILMRIEKETEQLIKHVAFHVIPRTPTDNVYIAWRPVLEMREILMNPQMLQLMENIRKKIAEG